MKKLFTFDWRYLFLILLLLFFSLSMMVSVAPDLWRHQLFFAALGLFLFWLFSQIDYQIWEKFSFWLYLGIVSFLATPFLFGTITRGSLRWLRFGESTLQPSEIIKPFAVLFLAAFLSKKEETSAVRVLQASLLFLLPLVLIFVQPDLGSSLVVFLSGLGIILASGISWSFLVFCFVLLLLLSPLAWQLLENYQKTRLYSFFNPESDPLGAGYHLIQAKVAVGSGQLLGRGWGRGTQAHLDFLPERHTDFIFAALAEELGFLGALTLLLVFAFLLYFLLKTAQGSSDRFGYLTTLGVFGLVFVQVVINTGMNLGLMPITGITLPLVSYGGSSLVATMIGLGVVANISKNARLSSVIEIR